MVYFSSFRFFIACPDIQAHCLVADGAAPPATVLYLGLTRSLYEFSSYNV